MGYDPESDTPPWMERSHQYRPQMQTPNTCTCVTGPICPCAACISETRRVEEQRQEWAAKTPGGRDDSIRAEIDSLERSKYLGGRVNRRLHEEQIQALKERLGRH